MSRFKHITADEIQDIGKLSQRPKDEFRNKLDELSSNNPKGYAELIAVMHIGRGDDSSDNYDMLIKELSLSPAPTFYINEKKRLFQMYIRNGLFILGE